MNNQLKNTRLLPIGKRFFVKNTLSFAGSHHFK